MIISYITPTKILLLIDIKIIIKLFPFIFKLRLNNLNFPSQLLIMIPTLLNAHPSNVDCFQLSTVF